MIRPRPAERFMRRVGRVEWQFDAAEVRRRRRVLGEVAVLAIYMERHFQLAQLLSDLNRHIADAEALAVAPTDAENHQKNKQLSKDLRREHAETKEELRELLNAEHERLKQDPGPNLRGRENFNTHTRVRMELLFAPAKRAEAERLLHLLSTERERFAALRLSGGDLGKLREAIDLGRADFRDLLMAAGFCHHPEQHQRWWPGQQTG